MSNFYIAITVSLKSRQFIDFANQEIKLCICMHSTKHVLKTPNGWYMPLIHPLIKFGFICIVNLQLIKLLSNIIIRHNKFCTLVRNNKRLWFIVKNLSSLRNRATIFTLGTTALQWFWLYTVSQQSSYCPKNTEYLKNSYTYMVSTKITNKRGEKR